MMNDLIIPLTNAQACAKYNTTKHDCTCADYIHRKGNYSIYGVKVCKHILYKIMEGVRNEYANRIGINPMELTDQTCTHSQFKQRNVVELPFENSYQVTLGNGQTFTRR